MLRTRIQVMPVIDALAGLGMHSGEPERLGLGAGVRTGWGDDWLQFGPVKVFTDGSILGRTARMTEHYEGCPGYRGYLQEDEQSLRRRACRPMRPDGRSRCTRSETSPSTSPST